MSFFIPAADFEHYGRFYSFPCYFAGIDTDAPTIAGTNIVWDWCILHVAPRLHQLIEAIRWMADPLSYEPADWQLEVLGKIDHGPSDPTVDEVG